MKHLFLGLLSLLITTTQLLAEPSGIPVKITAGKKSKPVGGFLQRVENNKLIFRRPRSEKDIPIPIQKVKKLTFLPKAKGATLFNETVFNQYFNKGEYRSLTVEFGSFFEPYWDYMAIENNLQKPFIKLIDSYLRQKSFKKVERAGKILIKSPNSDIKLKGQLYLALGELSHVDTNGVVLTKSLEQVEKIKNKMPSVAGKLYLQACIDRAKKDYPAAFSNLCTIISKHGNNMRWMPDAELLCAYIYLDSQLTNSAIGTAKQVQAIYKGSNVAIDAKLFVKNIKIAQKNAEQKEKEQQLKEEKENALLIKNERDIAKKLLDAKMETKTNLETKKKQNEKVQSNG